MSRVNPRKLNPKTRMECLDLLWTSISELRNREEVKNFFKDLLSQSEAIMIARRILIAKYLLEGKSYEEIYTEMKASDSTIANVHRWLVSGFGGYEKAIKNFENALGKRFSSSDNNKVAYSYSWMKKRYPLHFLLFNLIKGK